MAKAAKINFNFDDYTEDDFYNGTTKVYNSMVIPATVLLFHDLPVAMTVLGPLIDTFNKVRNALVYDTKGIDTQAARTAVQNVITKNGGWLNPFCAGNLTLLGKTGYPLAKDDVAQGKLEATILTLTNLVGTGHVEFLISYIKVKALRYGIMYTTADDTEMDCSLWKFYYTAQRDGVLKMLTKGVAYKMVSFAMGTSNDITYSDEVIITAL